MDYCNKKTQTMKIYFTHPAILLISIMIMELCFIQNTHGQTSTCTAGVENGTNLTVNGDFSAGNSGFTFTPAGSGGYTYFTCGNPFPSSGCFSTPGYIFVSGHSDWFNQSFNVGSSGFGNPIPDHTSATTDNNFLMVDGICNTGIKAWQQSITVVPGTWYYFECYVANLNRSNSSSDLAILGFDINGTNLTLISGGTTFTTSTTQGQWQLVSATWQAPAGVTTATISIENTTTSGCGTGVDFGIDDITFTAGCAFADNSTQNPTLSNTGTLCGTGGAGISLASGVPGTYSFTWLNSAGTTIATTGPNLSVSSADTYTVCVRNGGGCIKSASIAISGSYTLNTLPDAALCNPASALLDPGFTGTGVTYQWQSSPDNSTWTNIPGVLGTSPTYSANTAGYYRVTTNDPTPGCGSKTSNASHVTSLAAATPNNRYFCPNAAVNLSINNTPGHSYQWYTDANATSPIAGATNSNYVTPTLTGNATYYVKDLYNFSTTVGAATKGTPSSQTGLDQYAMQFTAGQSFTIDSITVYWFMNNNNPNDQLKIQFQLMTASSGTTNGTLVSTGPAFSTTNTLAQSAGLVLAPGWPNSPGQVYGVRVPVGITVPSAGNWGLTVNGGNTTGNVQIESGGTYSYGYTDASGTGVVTINSTQLSGNSATTTRYGGMYNWKIHYQNGCKAIPVTATADCTQPVEFIGFNLSQNSSTIDLSWETGMEMNADYFQIERSADGINFESIGKVKAVGNSYGTNSYDFTDYAPLQGTAYYRINEIDFDGASTFSRTLSVNEYDKLHIGIMPNPNSGIFSIFIENLQKEGNLDLKIFNALGENIYSRKIDCSGYSSIEKTIDLTDFSSGVYYLCAITDKNKVVQKIVKE
jgi:hypothetical protein